MTNKPTLPLFPLGVVLFPQGRMKLRIFEPRYLDMVKRCLQEDSRFGVVGIAEGSEAGEPASPFDVGVSVKIIDFEPLPDGLLGLTIEAEQRFAIVERWLSRDRLQYAEIDWLPDYESAPLSPMHQDYQRILKPVLPELEKEYGYTNPDCNNAAWVLGRVVEILPMPLAHKAELLALDHPHEALDDLLPYLQFSEVDETV